MKPKVYIDGKDGTTGLQIYQRLGDREDITLLSIDPSKRKDAAERKRQKMQAPAETREMYRRKRRPGTRNPEKIYLENLKRRHWTGKM